MILYAMSAQVSAIQLFTAGILPSLLIGVVDAIYVLIYARVQMVPLSSPARWKNIWDSTKEASWAIGTIVVIFGGIYGGVFTPTEAAGVAVVYSLLIAMFVYREIGLPELWQVIVSSMYPNRADPDHRHGCWSLFVVDDHKRHSAIAHRASYRDAPATLADALVRQCRSIAGRQLS